MTTQEEFFAKLGRPVDENTPKIPTLKFLEKNKPNQGEVVEVYPTIQRGFPKGTPDPVDANGNPKPLLIVTVKQKDGELGKIYYKGALLYSLRKALAEGDYSFLPVGSFIGSAWTGDKEMDSGFSAKQYTTKVKFPEA